MESVILLCKSSKSSSSAASTSGNAIVGLCTSYDLPEYLRITVGTAAQNTRVIAALEGVI